MFEDAQVARCWSLSLALPSTAWPVSSSPSLYDDIIRLCALVHSGFDRMTKRLPIRAHTYTPSATMVSCECLWIREIQWRVQGAQRQRDPVVFTRIHSVAMNTYTTCSGGSSRLRWQLTGRQGVRSVHDMRGDDGIYQS
ncbi:hypothetical protein BDN71DRAFT_1452330 [Pleurotus eryngii]|uniref:Uncharacterized protein n=1 Tax=Pleurotus eryngii TaxID=5323 RepID=A0A9P5ZRK8_PLEER|nr:hypothetical protein BDN71DRAFT_1452330 [Pleurotus eryngii]